MNQHNIDDFNRNDAIKRYDKQIKNYNVLWDDQARLMVKSNILTGSGNYKTLNISFKAIVFEKEEEILYSLKIPVK